MIKISLKILLLYILLTPFLLKAASSETSSEEFERKFGQMLMVGFKGMNGTFQSENSQMADLIHDGKIGNIILFTRNIDPGYKKGISYEDGGSILRENFHHFMKYLKDLNPTAFRAIDMEGGLVQRLHAAIGYPKFPSAADIGQEYEQDTAQGIHKAQENYNNMASLLHSLYLNMNLAPVVDLIPEEGDCPVISAYGRAFSKIPEHVAALSEIFITSHKELGISSCLKHAPGHGYAKDDTHFSLTNVTTSANFEKEMRPYNLLNGTSEFNIMMAHVLNQRLYDSSETVIRPASVCPIIIDKVRQEIGKEKTWEGLIISDALEMNGLHEWYRRTFPDYDEMLDTSMSTEEKEKRISLRWKQILNDAVMAGEDILLFGNVDAPFIKQVIQWAGEIAAESDDFRGKVEIAYARITDAKRKLGII